MYNILFSVIQRLLQTLCIVWNFCLMNPCIFSWNTGIFWTFNIQVVFLTKLKKNYLNFLIIFCTCLNRPTCTKSDNNETILFDSFSLYMYDFYHLRMLILYEAYFAKLVCEYITPPPTSHTKYLKLKLLHHCFTHLKIHKFCLVTTDKKIYIPRILGNTQVCYKLCYMLW